MFKNLFYFSIFIFVVTGCKKKIVSQSSDIIPTDLNFTVNVNTDNSGNVSFTATATNASVYVFDFGDASAKTTLATGAVNYKYISSGVYTATVEAKSSTGHSISKSILVTINKLFTLAWSDDFNGTGLPDNSKWTAEIGTGNNGWGNSELQYYTNRIENAEQSNGTLKINLKKEIFSGSNYTSARLITKDKFSFKYGRVEARAKLPAGVGTWPAIWMLGNNINTVNWPACGEIDIMEHVGKNLNTIYATLHYPGNSGGNATGTTTVLPTATSSFNIYATEWSPTAIKFFVNDVLFYTFPNNSNLPFNQNFFLILNVAMGGNFGGTPDNNITAATMEIDYLKVYQ